MSQDLLRQKYDSLFKKIKKGNAISIELECFFKGSYSLDNVAKLCLDNKLYNVDVTSDRSIRPDRHESSDEDDYADENTHQSDYTSVEFRITGEKSNITKLVSTVNTIIKLFKIKTNSTCGLHVHIDTRRYYSTGRVQLAGYYLANLIKLGHFVTKQREDASYYFQEVLSEFKEGEFTLTERNFVNMSDNHNTIELRLFGADSAKRHLSLLLKTIVGIEASYLKQVSHSAKRAREFFPVLQYK